MSTDGRFEGARYDAAWRDEYAPEPRELSCPCCGGYVGHGFTDRYCGVCRRGEDVL